jgi:hypothetical protein
MTGKRAHAFGDDLLGEHDAVALAVQDLRCGSPVRPPG